MNKYPKVRTVGHRDIADLLIGPVVVQEKVDGSNFSFGKDPDGNLFAWSRTQELDLAKPDGMFAPAVEHVKAIESRIGPGTIIRCEYLQRPKHNVLAYDRIPKNHLVLFQIDFFEHVLDGQESIYNHGLLTEYAEIYDIEAVPQIFAGDIHKECLGNWKGMVDNWLIQESFLGGQKIEGVVFKNFGQTDERSGAPYLVGKIVREEFKEVHRHQVKLEKPDPVSSIGARLGGPARWQKAYQHLAETGQLVHGMEDVPKLLRRVQVDVEMEEEDTIKEALYKLYRKQVIGNSSRGMAEWYKSRLQQITTGGLVLPAGGRIDL
jgi:hypothetical protein